MNKKIKVDDDGKIVDAKFKTFGCGSAIASSSLATEWVKGKHLDEAAGIKNSDIAKVSSHSLKVNRNRHLHLFLNINVIFFTSLPTSLLLMCKEVMLRSCVCPL